MRRKRRVKECHIRSDGRVGHADDLDLMRAQQRLKVEIAGVVNEYRIARAQQEAADQIDGLRSRIGEQDLVGTCRDPFICEMAREEPAQGRRAARAAVIRQHGIVGTGESADCTANRSVRHPVGGKPPASGLQHLGARVERLPRHPEGVDRPVESRLDFRQSERLRDTAGVEAGARPRTDHAFGGQSVIGFDHGRWRDIHRRGEAADRRQLLSGCQRPAHHLAADRLHHLAGAGQRLAAHMSCRHKCIASSTNTVLSNCMVS